MVRYGIQALVDRETQASDAQVRKIDLPVRGGLSGIDVVLRATNGSTSNKNNWITAAINKIEIVVNGDVRIFSLTGEEFFRYAWYRDGKPPVHVFTEAASGVQEVTFPIRFGRYLNDLVYGLDLSRFQNAQLVIDYNLANGGAIAATTYTTATFEISALLYITDADKSPAYRGAIGAREIENYTTVASGDKSFKLPPLHPLVGIGIYCAEDAIAEGTDVTHVRLSLDNDQKQPFRGRWQHHQAINAEQVPDKLLTYTLIGASADTVDVHSGSIEEFNFKDASQTWVTGTTDGLINIMGGTAAGNRITLAGNLLTGAKGGTTVAISACTAAASILSVKSKVVGHYVYWPFGDRESLADVLRPTEWGDASVIITQGGAGAYAAVIVEELRSF